MNPDGIYKKIINKKLDKLQSNFTSSYTLAEVIANIDYDGIRLIHKIDSHRKLYSLGRLDWLKADQLDFIKAMSDEQIEAFVEASYGVDYGALFRLTDKQVKAIRDIDDRSFSTARGISITGTMERHEGLENITYDFADAVRKMDDSLLEGLEKQFGNLSDQEWFYLREALATTNIKDITHAELSAAGSLHKFFMMEEDFDNLKSIIDTIDSIKP